MKTFLFALIIFTYLSGIAQQDKPCKNISYISPQKAMLSTDNGYRADSCEYHCLCEPQSVDGEKHYYYYDQFGRDTSIWNFYQDSIIDPWRLAGKDTREFYTFDKILNERNYWYEEASGLWHPSMLYEYTYNAYDQLIQLKQSDLWPTTFLWSKSDYTYDNYGKIIQRVDFYTDGTYPIREIGKTMNYYLTNDSLQYYDYFRYDTINSQWIIYQTVHHTYNTLWQLACKSVGYWSNNNIDFKFKYLYEYDTNGNLLRQLNLEKYTGSYTYDTTRVYQAFYNSAGKPDSALHSSCWSATHEWDMLEKFYYDSHGNQIRWEYYLHWQNDSVWQLFGWEDCYYSQHSLVHGISETAPEMTFTVFPNPASDQIQISTEESSVTEITIMDLRGAELMSLQTDLSNQPYVNISALPDGMYFIRCTAENGKSNVHSFVVQH